MQKCNYYKKSSRSKELREWVDNVLFKIKLIEFLDNNFINKFMNEDFFGRLWEIEILEWLYLTKIKMVSTCGVGPDFCLELKNGSRIWIEAVLSRPDDKLIQKHKDSFGLNNQAINISYKDTALRYSTNLFAKAKKIKDKYKNVIKPEDYVVIAVSSFPYNEMHPEINLFLPAILPIEFQVVYFPVNGNKFNKNIIRPTHTIKREYEKESGAIVKKEFLYPGDEFPYIDGVFFSEASNLQQLLGTHSMAFNDSTNKLHVFQNFAGKKLPKEFTKHFYSHQFINNGSMIGIEMINPISAQMKTVN